MEIKKNIILYIIIFPFVLLCKEFNYEVSIFGVYCADIKINYTDTIFNNQNALKIEYETKTRREIEYFFFIDNKYTSIINIDNYNMLSFYKKTKQPNVNNNISTHYKNDSLFYSNNNQYFNNKYYNIFSLLYFLQTNGTNNQIKSLNFLEREGNVYNMKIDTIESFIEYRTKSENLRTATIESNRRVLNLFLSVIGDIPVQTISLSHLDRFTKHS